METKYKNSYNFFKKLCASNNIGVLLREPVSVTGGEMHRMYCIETDKGCFAVKLLNPDIMARGGYVKDNYINSENIARLCSKNIPALPAINFAEIDGQFYLLFNWVNGKTLFDDDLNEVNIKLIAGYLRRIHETDLSELGLIDDYTDKQALPDWENMLNKAEHAVWRDKLASKIDELMDINKRLEASSKALFKNTLLSHHDLEPKNVLWTDDMKPIIIDWEAAGFINPYVDVLETGMYWSKDKGGKFNKLKFTAFVSEYIKGLEADKKVEFKDSLEDVLNMGYASFTGWLEYSMKRSLGIECADKTEQDMGTRHIWHTFDSIDNYTELITVLRDIIHSILFH